jgi:hypothetical protein
MLFYSTVIVFFVAVIIFQAALFSTDECYSILLSYSNYGSHLGPAMRSVLILIKCVFCGKCCVYSDTCVSIVVKIKCVNSGNISDICDKLNFTTNYIHFIKTHTNITIFYTFGGTVPPWDLSISIQIRLVIKII